MDLYCMWYQVPGVTNQRSKVAEGKCMIVWYHSSLVAASLCKDALQPGWSQM